MTLDTTDARAPYQPRSRREARELEGATGLFTPAPQAPEPVTAAPRWQPDLTGPVLQLPAPPRSAFTDPVARREELLEVPGRGPRPAAPRRRGILAQLVSAGTLLVVGAFVVGVSVPANAFGSSVPAAADESSLAAAAADDLAQSVAGNEDGDALRAPRDGYKIDSWAELLKERNLAQNYSYTITNGAIRWPFPFVVPIGDGYGSRTAPCRGCSTYHQGLDFLPGAGAAIFSVMGGTVVEHSEGGSSLGNFVRVESAWKGHIITHVYGHMEAGSSALAVGDQLKVGDMIGKVGMTGMATGPHLHLEIWVDGVKVDPFTWLKTNAPKS